MKKKRVYRERALSTKPRPLVGTKTWILRTERDMRDREFSDAIDPFVRALVANERERRAAEESPPATIPYA